MAQLTTDKITEIYCIADDFCKEFSKEIQKHQILPDDGKRHRNRSFTLHLVTGIKSNMKNPLMTMRDKILLRKRSVIETINDELKNICEVEHSRHRSPLLFMSQEFCSYHNVEIKNLSILFYYTIAGYSE
jgi:hypothetical protein